MNPSKEAPYYLMFISLSKEISFVAVAKIESKITDFIEPINRLIALFLIESVLCHRATL